MWQDKTVLLTGGSSGIGYALAYLLQGKGARVYSFDKAKPKSPVDSVTHIPVDLTDADQVKRAFPEVPSPIDVLFNNAGVMRRGTIFDTTEEEFDLLFDVNLKGSWLMLKYGRPHLAKDATVVQISSGHALLTSPDPGVYTLTKKAALALAEILERTCPDYSVKVACLGPVDTPLLRYGRNPIAYSLLRFRAHSPDYVAARIVELLESDKKRLIFDHDSWSYRLE